MKVTKLDDHLLEQMLENHNEFSIIEHYGLSENEVKLVVKEWYLNGMCLDILQNENGSDLEELLDLEFLIK
jgi:hypothetical protein